jgi:hypothetical protein
LLDGLVLLTDDRKTTFHLHAAGCNMVNTARPRGPVRAFSGDDLPEIVEVLLDWEFRILRCKCCG